MSLDIQLSSTVFLMKNCKNLIQTLNCILSKFMVYFLVRRYSKMERDKKSTDLFKNIRYWDQQISKWLMRYFYFFFFHIILFIIFINLIINIFRSSHYEASDDIAVNLQKMLSMQNYNIMLMVFLMILNSFWLLNLLQTLMRIVGQLKDSNYHLSRLRFNNHKK